MLLMYVNKKCSLKIIFFKKYLITYYVWYTNVIVITDFCLIFIKLFFDVFLAN